MTQFVSDCVRFILQNTEGAEKLIDQLDKLTITEKEHTGVGAFYSFLEESDPGENEVRIGIGHTVYSEKFPDGADISLVITNGKIDYLEVLANAQQFPKSDPENYHFKVNPVNIINDRGN